MVDGGLDLRHYYWACVHVVEEVLVEIIKVEVVKVNSIQRIIICFLDFRDVYQEDFSAKILDILRVFVF